MSISVIKANVMLQPDLCENKRHNSTALTLHVCAFYKSKELEYRELSMECLNLHLAEDLSTGLGCGLSRPTQTAQLSTLKTESSTEPASS